MDDLTMNLRETDYKKIQTSFSFRVTLFSDGKKESSVWLPCCPDGFYRVSEDYRFRFLTIEAKDNQWYVCCRRPGFFANVPPELCSQIPITYSQYITSECEDISCFLFIERICQDNVVFTNYTVHPDVNITIGSAQTNDIWYDSKFIKPQHAILIRKTGKWFINGCGNDNNVYVNGFCVSSSSLTLGDLVFLSGLRIIIGTNFISVSGGDVPTVVKDRVIKKSDMILGSYKRYSGQIPVTPQDNTFNRLPRKRLFCKSKTISIDSPPMSTERAQMPLMLRMGSSAIMSGKAALSGNYTMLLSSLLFPILSSNYSENQRKEYEKKRTAKYTEYLEMKHKEILAACDEEETFLNIKYPDVFALSKQADYRKHIWERRPQDDDFLALRLGCGQVQSKTVIEYTPKHFELEIDPLEETMYQLAEQQYVLRNVPIILSAIDDYVCGISGPREQIITLIQQLVTQTAFFHSYDEVKLIFLMDEDDMKELSFVRFIPHVWDNQRSIRFIANNEEQAYQIGEYLRKQLPEVLDESHSLDTILKHRAYYLVFALSKKLLDSVEIIKTVMQTNQNCGVSVFSAFEELPKECKKIISLSTDRNHTVISLTGNTSQDVSFWMDELDSRQMHVIMGKLANLSIRSVSQKQEIPKMVTFLEMFHAGRIEHLNSSNRWRENDPVVSLTTPVGLALDGSLFTLDLHEKKQGPHGLVAGMTGSGKSEFLITYILSMAVNYHPDEVAFVLIDYKGGGLAGAFENPQTGVRLPHLVGTITNLDGASVQRSLISIESELIRRQKVLNAAKITANEGTMDIYSYQKLYRAGKVKEPMPHLFIISDEFAELKQQQPEFMENLISAARIGRSLGIHLILATQKPSGIVNDQIRSNTKFRVCLRVQDRADSMDMLKRPEAAELTDTGRFYLQVGYNEYFAQGQSAWCGASYEPQDTVAVHQDNAVEFLDTTGQTLVKSKPKERKKEAGMKQLVAIVEYLSKLADAHNIHPRQLWRPELPNILNLDELNTDGDSQGNGVAKVILGKLDDPEMQEQYEYSLDFRTCQNVLIAGTMESGKTTILQNIIYSLSRKLTPKDFNFYVLDYSSRMMKLFKDLPHCGAVIQEEDISSVDEFFKLINGIVADRKKLYSELEVDNFEAACAKHSLPLVLVLIDNIAALNSSRIGEKHMYQLQSYLKDSYNYGVKYIITCNHLNEVSSRIRQELGERIALHLKDKYDYTEMLGCRPSFIPTELPGRGLCRYGERALEFQGALIQGFVDSQERAANIREMVAELISQHGHISEAQRLPVIQDDVTYEEFAAQFKKGRIPLGYSKSTKKPVALPLKQLSLLSIYFGNSEGTVTLMNNFLHAFERENMELWIIRKNTDSLFVNAEKKGVRTDRLQNADYMDCSVENMRALQHALLGIVAQRKQFLDKYCEEHKISREECVETSMVASILREHTKPLLLLIENVGDFCASLNALSVMSYCNLFGHMQKYNVYVVGCFEPDIPEDQCNNNLFMMFSDADILLFGGNFSKQSLFTISNGELPAVLPINSALMRYRKSAYALTMPCGNINKPTEDEDLLSIF